MEHLAGEEHRNRMEKRLEQKEASSMALAKD